MSTIINLYGGPGTGKSTTMALVYAGMKLRGQEVEMAPEWVKGPVWAGQTDILDDQLYITAKQNHILDRLYGNVETIVTDAPLLGGLVYCDAPLLREVIRTAARCYRNEHIFLERVKPYRQGGRVQDEGKARELDLQVQAMLKAEVGSYLIIPADENAASKIMLLVFLMSPTSVNRTQYPNSVQLATWVIRMWLERFCSDFVGLVKEFINFG